MTLKDWRNILFLTGFIIIVFIVFPFQNSYLNVDDNSFIALAVLGQDGLAEEYYPNDNLNVSKGVPIKWNIHLFNHMGDVQYVKIVVKILGNNVLPSNISNFTPSPSPVIFEYSKVLLDNETIMMPFKWSVVKVERNEEILNITKIRINENTLNVNITSNENEKLGIKFELWIYNISTKKFEFTLSEDNIEKSVWTQFWFLL